MKTLVVTDAHKTSLAEDGYVVFPQVLDASEIKKLRQFFDAKLAESSQHGRIGNSPSALFDIFGRYPETRWLLYHQPTNEILRSLLEQKKIVNLRATTLLHQKSSPWHNETTEMEEGKYTFPRDPECKLLQTVVYLQDNKGAYGTALDVDKGSHNLPDPFQSEDDYTAKNKTSIETTAGDLLVFDWKLAHKATPSLSTRMDSPIKLGIFGSYSNKEAYADLYNEFSNTCDKWPFLHNFSYPAELIEQAKSHSIVMA